MSSASYDERQVLEWTFRWGVPTFAWALVFTFFAFADSVSTHEPSQVAHAAPAASMVAGDCVHSAPR